MRMAKVAIFASGRGSNFIAIHEYLESIKNQPHCICCLVTDKPKSGAAEYAAIHNIPILSMDYSKGKSRENIETELISQLKPLGAELLVLAGFMRLLTPVLIDAWQERIINIHPALLPKYKGAHGIEESYASTDLVLGITIHYVDAGLDSGPILIQKSFERQGTESLEEIRQRIHELEHATYPKLVHSLLDNIVKSH